MLPFVENNENLQKKKDFCVIKKGTLIIEFSSAYLSRIHI